MITKVDRIWRRTIGVLALGAAVVAPGTAHAYSGCVDDGKTVIAITGVSVHGRGDSGADLDRSVVLIENGRIVAVGADVAIPDGATRIELEGGAVTPGLIDANAWLEPDDMVTAQMNQWRPRDDSPVEEWFAYHAHLRDAHGVEHTDSAAHGEHGEGGLLNPWEGDPQAIDECLLAAAAGDEDGTTLCPICGGPITESPGDDAFASGVNWRYSQTEASSEVVPHTMVADSLDLLAPDLEILMKEGVTTVYASPEPSAVIGPRGAIVRTAGPLSERLVTEAAAVQATLGSDSFRLGAGNRSPYRGFVSMRTRRPNSRMGVSWVFRKAFYDAEKHHDGLEVTGADAPPIAAMEALRDLRNGSIPLRIQARTERDIMSAIALADEFDLDFTLLEATEAYRAIDAIVNAGLPVIFGPIYSEPGSMRAYVDGARDSKLATFATLINSGAPTALSARDLRGEDGLARQVMYAMRTGVPFDEALRAVTLTPAEMLGLADEVGSIETGKRADVVVWNGQPFAATSRPVVVVVGGVVEHDARTKN
ncbi:MAG: amidohydrolase family protein [Phycisphaerales bacterium]